MDTGIYQALPFVAFLYLVYLIIASKAKFELVFSYACLLLVILGVSLHNERRSWALAILPSLVLIDAALLIGLSTNKRPEEVENPAEETKHIAARKLVRYWLRNLMVLLLAIFVGALNHYPSSWRLTLLFILFLLDLALCVALSPAQVYFFGLEANSKHIRSLEVIYPRDRETSTNQVSKGVIDADIVAVHGLGSVPDRAWAYESEEAKRERKLANRGVSKHSAGEQLPVVNPDWLKDFLPEDCPNLRIMKFNHNTNWQSFALRQNLSDHAHRLLQMLHLQRKNSETKSRPIIFVGYSFGGIIVKQAMVLAAQAGKTDANAYLRNIFNAPHGFIFLGTPHGGSRFTVAGRICALFSYWGGSSTNLLDAIDPESTDNKTRHDLFLSHFSRDEIVCFYETEPEVVGGFQLTTVVNEDSGSIPGRPAHAMPERHRNIHKFESRKDEGYQLIQGEIARVVEHLSLAKQLEFTGTPKGPQYENASRAAAQNLSHAVDTYLDSIALPPAFISDSGAPRQQASLTKSPDVRESLNWFFDSPEFATWYTGRSSSFLWCSGVPGSGKTVLSCFLEDSLRLKLSYRDRRDVITIFCSPSKDRTKSTDIGGILGSIASQLLHRDENRLKYAFQQYPPQKLLPAHPPLSFGHDYQEGLWSMIRGSLTTSPECEIDLILDGVNEIRPEHAREKFLSNIVMLFDNIKSLSHITVKVFVTSLPFRDIQQAFKDLPSIEKDKERQACLRTLHFSEYNFRQGLVASANTGTGDWILSHSKFTAWDTRQYSDLLWLHGKPGSGKSTLLKQVVARKTDESTRSMKLRNAEIAPNLEYVDYMGTDRDVIVAAFFYSLRGKKTEMSHTLMLRSLLYQILEGNSKLFACFRPMFRELSKTESNPKWTYENLKSVFISLRTTRTPVKIYVIVDAMDESAEGGRPEILTFLSDLCSSKSSCVFKGLIASRPYIDIQKHLHAFDQIVLQHENSEDIKTVIHEGLKHFSENNEVSQEQLNVVQKYLIDKCDGVFLWVSVILKELEDLVFKGLNKRMLQKLLESLPTELVELYKRIVDRLKEEPSKIQRTKKMLNWTAFAERPLTLEELGDAIIVPSDGQQFLPTADFIYQERLFPFKPLIASYCGGLLEIRPGNVIQLLHQTTRDFILDEECSKPFHTDELQGDTEIVLVCLRYLGLLVQSRGSLQGNTVRETQDFVTELADRPLLDYTLTFLPTHLKQLTTNGSKPECVSRELSKLIESLEERPRSLAYKLLERWLKEDLSSYVKLELDPESARESRNAILAIAAQEGHANVVKSSLRAHAEINRSRNGRFPLGLASFNGHKAVVKLLLDAGADVNAPDRDYGNALQAASDKGHKEVVELLFDAGANVNALQAASAGGHKQIVKLLLDKGADVNIRGGYYGNALQAASAKGHEKVVRLLLSRGADVDAEDGYGNALQVASAKGHEEVVKLLLNAGANVNAQDSNDSNALQAASAGGHKQIVKLLLDKGADVNIQGGYYGNALQAASAEGHEKIVRLLLDAGANVNAQDGYYSNKYYGNALQAASAKGHEEIVRLLLSRGANVNAQDEYYGNALQAASVGGHEQIVKLLLDNGADVTLQSVASPSI